MFDLFTAHLLREEYSQDLQEYLEYKENNRQELIRLYIQDFDNLREITDITKRYLENSEQVAYCSYMITLLTRIINNLTP